MNIKIVSIVIIFVFSGTNSTRSDFVQFYLYSRDEPEGNLLKPNTYKYVNFKKSAKFIVHGFTESYEIAWCQEMMREYLKKGDFNVILVDWSSSALHLYSVESVFTQTVGHSMADLILTFCNFYGLPLSNVHLIGHSLGAHVCGYAGNKIRRKFREKVPRITALDAAGILFEFPYVLRGLTKHDADIVDVIHTDGGVFGRSEPTGTIDFYPNGGVGMQPGCQLQNFPHFTSSDFIDMIFCSHRKSVVYFINSINKQKYVGFRCDSWEKFIQDECDNATAAVMGDDYKFEPGLTEKFYLYII